MRKEISKPLIGIVTAILTVYLLVFWRVDYSVYKMPFNPLRFDLVSLGIYVYRFCLGFVGSCLFILLSSLLVKMRLFSQLSKLGRYTLIMYTVSVICKYVIQNYVDRVINEPIYLECISLVATIILIILSVGLTKLLERNRVTSLLFLGH